MKPFQLDDPKIVDFTFKYQKSAMISSADHTDGIKSQRSRRTGALFELACTT